MRKGRGLPSLPNQLTGRHLLQTLLQYVPLSFSLSGRMLNVKIIHQEQVFVLPALTDSGAVGNFINDIYSLAHTEHKAIEQYAQEAFQQGNIRPTSPAFAGFFFVGKKGRGLNLCIDYRAFNMVKCLCPLQLVPSALEQLCSAKIFTKLDLLSAYNLVRIQPGDKCLLRCLQPL